MPYSLFVRIVPRNLFPYECIKGILLMNIDYEKQVGARLRTLREERKLTQELASARLQLMGCDITRSALAKIEVGQRHLYVDELYCLGQVLEVSIDDILLPKTDKQG